MMPGEEGKRFLYIEQLFRRQSQGFLRGANLSVYTTITVTVTLLRGYMHAFYFITLKSCGTLVGVAQLVCVHPKAHAQENTLWEDWF